MTDAVQNSEIEDVLSSIRRLVAKGDAAARGADAEPAVSEKPAEKLVLTPSQRVEEPALSEQIPNPSEGSKPEPARSTAFESDVPEAPFIEAEPAAMAAPTPLPVDDAPATLVQVEALARKLLAQDSASAQEAILLEIRKALKGSAASDTPEVSQDTADSQRFEAAVNAASETVDDDTLGVDDATEVALEKAPDALPDNVLRLEPETQVKDTMPEVTRQELMPEPAPEPEAATPPAAEAATQAPEQPEAAAPAAPVEQAETSVAETPEEDTAEESIAITEAPQMVARQAQDMSTKQAAASLEAKIAELEALIGRSDTNFEPDQSDRGGNAAADFSGMGEMPWEEGSADDPRAEPAASDSPETVADDKENDDEGELPQETIMTPPPVSKPHLHLAYNAQSVDETEELDEDELRELVSRLVREELQGALGERITRSVRKLVRREVQRALMDRDLE